MSLNVFYLSPINRKTVSIELKINENIEDLCENISLKESIPRNEFKLYSNGKRLQTTEHLINDSVIGLHLGLNGGKGGFGSMLRAIGAQIEKTTNREACRDLTGRRLRDVNEEKRIKEWIKKEKIRKEEMEAKRRQKLENMTKRPKTEFNDLEFERNREEIPDIVENALQYGLQVQQREQESTSGQQSALKRKTDAKTKQIKKKKVSLLIGVEDIDDSESDDSSDEQPSDETNDQKSTEDLTDPKDDSNESEVTIDTKSADNDSQVKQSIDESSESTIESTNHSNDGQMESKNEKQSMGSTDKSELVSGDVTAVQTESTDSETKPIEPMDSKAESSSNSSESKPEVFEALNLNDFQSVDQLESLGLDKLKHSLMALGLKCGGTLSERANRLWSVRGLAVKDFPKKLLTKKK